MVYPPDEYRSPSIVKDKSQHFFVKGLAALFPLVVTLLIIAFVFRFISNALAPLLEVLDQAPYLSPLSSWVVLAITGTLFCALVFVIGFLSEKASGVSRINSHYDEFMCSIPGFGRVYQSFDEMSKVMFESGTDSFQEVKLVEYPQQNSYVIAFKTSVPPERISEQIGNDDMITLFMPMAPNPVMGGFVIHVARENVYDVDLTVEEGIRTIITSGVATGNERS